MKNLDEGRPIDILLVEENTGDVRLTMEALKKGKLYHNLNVVKDGGRSYELPL